MRILGRGKLAFARRLAIALLASIAAAASPAMAVVVSNGDVFPKDDPLTPFDDEGIPGDGNFIDPFATDPLVTYSTAENIVVGDRASGSLLLSGESELRYQYLVIGGTTDDIAAADAGDPDLVGFRSGRGIVRIEGFGTAYNNDPWIQPFFPFVTPQDDNRNLGTGYDIYVGLSGNGTLSINNGGRAETRDGVIVGYGPGAVGLVEVVGLDSYLLASGLLQDPGASFDPDENDPILLGTYGFGTLAITDGGVVDALVGIGLGAGRANGEQADGGSNEDYGGRGEVVLMGENSLLRVLYSFAIGEFEENDEVEYRTNAGQGVVTIGVGSRVTVDTIDDDDPLYGNDQREAEVRIGRFGELNMEGGRLIAADRLMSDGFVGGDGRIDVGYFYNRRQGDVRVGLDQKLTVVSNSDEAAITVESQTFFMANYGLVEVLGGEIEFDRLFEDDEDRFLNFSQIGVPDQPDIRGHLYGQDAVMRFRSGLLNRGRMSFTAGDNTVEGDVINGVAGVVTVAGPGTTLSFQDHVLNNGIIDIAPESSVVNFLGGFTNGPTGVVQIALGGHETFFPHSSVVGDINLQGGVLDVDIFNSPTSGSPLFNPQAGDAYEIFSATGELNGVFAVQDFTDAPLDPGLTWFVDYNAIADTITLRVSELMAIGADFNGDGIVDRLDLAIWQANFGILMGATGLQGDANGDGAVNGLDYFVWLDQNGMAPSVPATGAGGAVPEPSTLALLVLAGLGGLCLCRWNLPRAA